MMTFMQSSTTFLAGLSLPYCISSYTISGTVEFFCFIFFLFIGRPDEAELFAKFAQHAYKQFRDKAAFSRSMTVCLESLF